MRRGKKMLSNTKLAQILIEKNLSQTDLAVKLGIAPSTISSYATGRVTPRPGRRNKIAEALGVSADSI